MYQIGALKAIQELGYWDDTVSISSCSIGAVNAVLSTQYSIDECYHLWKELSTKPMFKNIDQYAPDYLFDLMKEWLQREGVDFNPFIEHLEKYIDENIVRQTNKEIIITALNQTKRKQEYHSLEDIPFGQLIQYISASARLPFFKPVFIDGNKYVDGGIGDNHPYYTKLDNTHFDLLIMVKVAYVPFFIPALRKKNITFDKEIIITPSKNIGTPIEFKSPSFDQKFEMGYGDAMRLLGSEKV